MTENYAAQHGIDSEAAITSGMQEKAAEFKEKGSEIYLVEAPKS